MSCNQYKTIPADEYPLYKNDWNIKIDFDECAIETFCTRSQQNIKDCENLECSKTKSHKSSTRVSKMKKYVIYKPLFTEILKLYLYKKNCFIVFVKNIIKLGYVVDNDDLRRNF